MSVITVSALFCLTLTQAVSLNTGPDYLDPILYQEHLQSSNGRYKYGYESNKARAEEDHDSTGTIRGLFSYLDDQGKVHRAEYLDDYDKFKAVGDHDVSGYTPEVQAARKAHLDMFLETLRRDLAQSARPLATEPITRQEGNGDKSSRINIPLNTFLMRPSTFGNEDINLFSGKPLHSSYEHNNYNFHPSDQTSFPTTTPRPQESFSNTVDNKFYVLPTPTVHHYEKIWPLPPLRFKDLEVRVNGQDWYDPRPRESFTNTVLTPYIAQKPQNSFSAQQKTIPFLDPNKIPFVNQFIQDVRPTNTNTGSNMDHFSKPPFPILTDQFSQITEIPQNIFQSIQSGLQSLNSNRPFTNPLSQVFRPVGTDSHTPTQVTEQFQNAIFNTPQMIFQAVDYSNNPFLNPIGQNTPLKNKEVDSRTSYSKPSTSSGWTAHQADLFNYREGLLEKNIRPINTDHKNEDFINSDVTITIRNNVEDLDDKRTKLPLSNDEKNIAALAAKKTFNLRKWGVGVNLK